MVTGIDFEGYLQHIKEDPWERQRPRSNITIISKNMFGRCREALEKLARKKEKKRGAVRYTGCLLVMCTRY
jgi:hypothetical protein